MKSIKTLLKVKEQEISSERRKLREILNRLENLKLKERELRHHLNSLKRAKVNSPFEFGFLCESGKAILREIESVKAEIARVQEEAERQKEVVALKRGELKAIERFIEKKKREKEQRDELLLERFINEVFNSRFNS